MKKVTIPSGYYSIKATYQKLKDLIGSKLGYTGLLYYRDIDLLDLPLKIEGYREKFYNLENVAKTITEIRFLAFFLDKNFSELAALKKKISKDNFNVLFFCFMKLYREWDVDVFTHILLKDCILDIIEKDHLLLRNKKPNRFCEIIETKVRRVAKMRKII